MLAALFWTCGSSPTPPNQDFLGRVEKQAYKPTLPSPIPSSLEAFSWVSAKGKEQGTHPWT